MSCSFDSLVESGRRSGDGGIQIHYVDEGAPGVSMKHDYDKPRWWDQTLFFSPLPGAMIQLTNIFQMG